MAGADYTQSTPEKLIDNSLSIHGMKSIRELVCRNTLQPKGVLVKMTRFVALFIVPAILMCSSGCSVRKFAVKKIGDALASSGTTFAADDDPQLVREAVPFSLKLIESLLAETPRHQGL